MKINFFSLLFSSIKIKLKTFNSLLIILFIALSFNVLNIPSAFAALKVEGNGNFSPAFTSVGTAKFATTVVDAGNYTGSTGTIGNSQDKLWRVDRQPPTSDSSNIQIQRNGVKNQPTTIGAVLVPIRYSKEINSTSNNDAKRAKFSELTGAIRNGLTSSIQSHRKGNVANSFQIQVFKVTGNFSA
jgi:hypothetical protein